MKNIHHAYIHVYEKVKRLTLEEECLSEDIKTLNKSLKKVIKHQESITSVFLKHKLSPPDFNQSGFVEDITQRKRALTKRRKHLSKGLKRLRVQLLNIAHRAKERNEV